MEDLSNTPADNSQNNLELSQSSPRTSFRSKKILFIASGLVIVVVLVLGIMLLVNSQKTTEQDQATLLPTATVTNSPATDNLNENVQYAVRGTTIVENVNGTERILFTNVKDVTAVRPGPDGNTLHFKTNQTQDAKYCASFASQIQSPPPGYTNPPPQQPPWNYKFLGHAYTISDCGSRTGGYLKNSDNFSYLVIDNTRTGAVVIENQKDNTSARIAIDSNLLSGFFDGSNEKVNSYWSSGITGKDGKNYFYPSEDSYEVNGKLVLAFARLVLAVDTTDNKLLGSIALIEPEYNIVATSFWFESKQGMPVVVVDSGWEGATQIQAILDFSGKQLKTAKLTGTASAAFNIFDLERVEWSNDGVKVNFYKTQDLSLPKDLDYEYLSKPENESIKKQEEQKLKTQFLQTGAYKDVYCDLNLGMLSPACWGLISIESYLYRPGSQLQKL